MKQIANSGKDGTSKILNSSQVYITMFVSQALLMLTMNTVYSNGARMQDFLISVGIDFVLNILLLIPTAFLLRLRPGKSILEISRELMGRWAVIVYGIYLLFYITTASYYLSFFQLFLANVLDPRISLLLVATAVMGVSAYSAWRGLEAVVRVGEIVAVILVFGFIFLLTALFPKVESIEFLPFFENSFSSFMTGALLLFSRSSALSMVGILIPHTKGRKVGGFLLFNLAFYIIFSLILIVCVGTMGGYLDHWLFPVYSASAFAQTGLLQSMDALFVAMWIWGLMTKLSMDLSLSPLCCRHISPRVKKWPILPIAAISGIISLMICYNQAVQSLFFSLQLLLPILVLTLGVIPIVLLILCLHRKKQEVKGGKANAGQDIPKTAEG